jgi:hypothetical protein
MVGLVLLLLATIVNAEPNYDTACGAHAFTSRINPVSMDRSVGKASRKLRSSDYEPIRISFVYSTSFETVFTEEEKKEIKELYVKGSQRFFSNFL